MTRPAPCPEAVIEHVLLDYIGFIMVEGVTILRELPAKFGALLSFMIRRPRQPMPIGLSRSNISVLTKY